MTSSDPILHEAVSRRAEERLEDGIWLAREYQRVGVAGIARKLGVGVSVVAIALGKHAAAQNGHVGDVRRHRLRVEDLIEDRIWLEARYQDSTLKQIADDLRVAPRRVRHQLDRHGIALRPQAGSKFPPGCRARRLPAAAQKKLADRRWLEAKYREHGSRAVAAKLGVGVGHVRDRLLEHGIPFRRVNRISESAQAKLDDGKWLAAQYRYRTIQDIATELGVTAPLVGRILKRHGVKLRGRGNPPPIAGRRDEKPYWRRVFRPLDRAKRAKLADRAWLEDQLSKRAPKEIAASLAVSQASIDRYIQKHGIERLRFSNPKLRKARPKLLDRPWLLEQYNRKNRTATEIAVELGVSVSVVGRYLAKAGIRRISQSARGPSPERLARAEVVRALLARGWTYREIADHLRLALNTVKRLEQLRARP